MKKIVELGALAVLLVAACACERRETVGDRRTTENTPLETPARERGPRVANHAAVQTIATARCDREARCDNLGANKKYSSRDTCKTALTEKNSDQFARNECPGGVDQKELRECIEEIKNEDCNNPLDALERLAACRPTDLCVASR